MGVRYNDQVFKDYLATKTDLKTVEEGLKTVWRPELDFIFNKKELIASTVVVSYDSKYIYLWMPVRNKQGKYFLRKILHSLSIPSKYHYAWYTGLWEKIEELLPISIKKASRFAVPRIGGGLLTPFITLQKSYKVKSNPYTIKKSYLATIVHEFGHVYWNQHKLWWYSDKKENLHYIEQVIKANCRPIYLSLPVGIGELYAFCAEYSASTIFWSTHRKNLDRFIQRRLKKLLNIEAKKNLDRENSVIEPSENPHDFAFILGKIILTRHPKLWPIILTRRLSLID